MRQAFSRERFLENHGGIWRPIAVAAGLGPLGLLFWSWLYPHPRHKRLVVALIGLWIAQWLLCVWMLPSGGNVRWAWHYNIWFANLFAVSWLLGALLLSESNSGSQKWHCLPYTLHLLLLESWLPILGRILMWPHTPSIEQWLVTGLVGFIWIICLAIALPTATHISVRKARMPMIFGWVLAIGVGMIAVILFYIPSKLL